MKKYDIKGGEIWWIPPAWPPQRKEYEKDPRPGTYAHEAAQWDKVDALEKERRRKKYQEKKAERDELVRILNRTLSVDAFAYNNAGRSFAPDRWGD